MMYNKNMNFIISACDNSLIEIPLNEEMKSVFSDGFFQWNIKHMHDQLVNDKSLYRDLIKDKKDIVMVDIGANIGVYSLYFSKICKKLYSVEPAPMTYKILNYVTSFLPQIETHKLAISNKNGLIDFYCVSPYNQSSSLFKDEGVKFYVKTKTLVDFIQSLDEESIDIVKIDTEGAENLFLNIEVIEALKSKVKQYYIECHESIKMNGNTQKDNFIKFTNMFEQAGYKLKTLNDERFITLM